MGIRQRVEAVWAAQQQPCRVGSAVSHDSLEVGTEAVVFLLLTLGFRTPYTVVPPAPSPDLQYCPSGTFREGTR